MDLRRYAAALAAALFFFPLFPHVPAAAQSAPPVAEVRTLANGLRVVVLEDHAVPVAQVTTWYRFGGLDETPGKSGLAHALEHMMFRGTKDLSSAGIDDMSARLGADVNAQTQNEATHFYFTVPADKVSTVMHVEADRMRNLKLAPSDWNLERGAVLQEWAQDHSNPIQSFIYGVGQRVYPNSRLGDTALGAKADIERATVADLRKYYDEWYHPNNATVVVTGDVRAADVFADAQRWFGAIPEAKLPARRTYTVAPAHGTTYTDHADYPFTLIDEAYAAPGDAPATEYHQLRNDVAFGALFNPRGPYRKALVESGLVLGFEPVPMEDRRASTMHVLLIVAPGHTVDEVRGVYEKTTAEILARGLDPEYITASKREMIASLQYARDSISGLADAVGGAYVFPGDTDFNKYAGIFAAVTPAEVDSEARAVYAKPSVTGVLLPTTSDPAKAKAPPAISSTVSDDFGARVPNGPLVQPAWLKSDLAQPLRLRSAVDPVVTTLPNGLHLLVQRVTTNPTVFVRGVVRLSPTFDPPGKDGLATVTSDLMGWGSAKYDYDAQHKLSDDLAAQISVGTSFGAHGRARDLGTMLDVLSDGVLHPLLPADKFALVKSQLSGFAERRRLQAGFQAEQAMAQALYPAGDPALRVSTPATIDALTLDDVRAFHARYIRPDLTTLVVVGDVDPATVAREVAAHFGTWTASGPAPDPHLGAIPLPFPQRKFVGTAAQTVSIELGGPTLARTSPDYEALVLANAIYGGGTFGSRLFNEVRQKRGLVYGAYSSLSADRDRGTFSIGFSAIPSKVDEADSVVRAELKRMLSEPVSESELARAKTRVVATALIAEQATAGVASDLLRIGVDGLPATYYAQLAQRYAGITPADVQRAARAGFHPDNLVEVRVGPPVP